jgi:hypothetical protein
MCTTSRIRLHVVSTKRSSHTGEAQRRGNVVSDHKCSIKTCKYVASQPKLTHEMGNHHVGFLPKASARANKNHDDEIAYFQLLSNLTHNVWHIARAISFINYK